MRSFYLLCEEPKELTIKGLPMSCHCYSGLITGHDDGITLGGFVYLNSSYDFVEEDEDNNDPTPSPYIEVWKLNFC